MRSRFVSWALIGVLMFGISSTVSAREEFTLNPRPDSPIPNAAPVLAGDRSDLILESFEEAVPPDGWDIIHLGTTYTWARSSDRQRTGAYSAKVAYGPQGVPQDEYLVLPRLDLSASVTVYLEFYEDQTYWDSYGDHHYVGVSTSSQDDPATFTMIETWTPGNHVVAGFEGDPVIVDLSAFAGEDSVYVCLRYTGTWADNWYVDDLRVFEPYEHDVAVTDVLPNYEHFDAPADLLPQVAVWNLGRNDETFTVELRIERSGEEVYFETLPSTLLVGEESTLDFPALGLEPGNYYKMQAEAVLAADNDLGNNSGTACNDSYTRPHVPLGWFHTNAGCGYCAGPEAILDAYAPVHSNEVVLIRMHTWWPNAGDIMWQQSSAQAHPLIMDYGADYTPHLWVDGVIDAGSDGTDYTNILESRRLVACPFDLYLHWRPELEELLVKVVVQEPLLPCDDYRLCLAVTEDNIYFAGGNGHNIHQQAFRYMYPDIDGINIPHEPGVYSFVVDCPLDPLAVGWDYDNLRMTAYIRDCSTRRIWQSCSGLLGQLTGQFSIDPTYTLVHLEDGTFSIDIDIAPASLDVKGLEIDIDFDENIMRLDSIIPGTWFSESGQGFFFDYNVADPPPTDTIHITAAFLDSSACAAGQMATCYFTPLDIGGTELDFLMSKVRDRENFELNFTSSALDSIIIVSDLTGLPESGMPSKLRMLGVSPNPFNPRTVIAFELPRSGDWRVEIFDVGGRRLRELAAGPLTAGPHELSWDGRDERGTAMVSGVYFARVSGVGGSVCARMVLLK